MAKFRWFQTIIYLFFLHNSLAEASERELKLITATGRAAIISDEQMQETRSRALEDALYTAALMGGAKIDGFSSIQAGTQLDDHFVVRPSSKIVDYDVVNEQFDDLHYAITIEAAVGDVGKIDCQNRPVTNATMFAPTFKIDNKLPAWISHTPSGLMKDIYEQLTMKPEINIIYKANVKLRPAELTRDHRYNYLALTKGVTRVREGDFSFATRLDMKKMTLREGFQENHFVDTIIETKIFIDSDFKESQTVTDQTRTPIRNVSALKFIDQMTSPNRSKIRSELFELVSQHAAAVAGAMKCTPLAATMVAKKNGLHVPIGASHGLQENRLAVVSDGTLPWTILRVVETDKDSAVLKPLNRERSLSQLSGHKVSFMEFN